jgi:DNA polymerase-3 subunit alpha
VVDFYRMMIWKGIKPIIGCDCYLAPRTIADKTLVDHQGVTRLTLLAENMDGYQNLCRLATIAATSGFYNYPRIDRRLLQKYNKGLICLSGGMQGDIAKLLQQVKNEEAANTAKFYQRLFGEDNFFLEIQRTGLTGQDEINQALSVLGKSLSIPLVGTNNCRYLEPGDSQYLEILLCLKAEKQLYDPDRPTIDSDQLYVKSAQEMCSLLADSPEALENTIHIASRCNVEFDLGTYHLPRTSQEQKTGQSADEILKEKAEKGLLRRLKARRPHEVNMEEDIYKTRLAHELAVIQQAEMARYFLLAAEIVDYTRENNIPVGPGRGATPGILVCYCLGITDIDPVVHGLLFERAFNSRYIADLDFDVCINGREQIVRYILDKYNKDDVMEYGAAQIISFGSRKTRATIRDVGKVLGISKKKTNKIVRLIPFDAWDLEDALAKEPALRETIETCTEYGDLLISANKKLDGLPRHPSIHAAGIVIGDKPLTNYSPLSVINGTNVTQFDLRDIESLGLYTLDFLGLRNLTMMKDTLALIQKQGKTLPDMDHLDMAGIKKEIVDLGKIQRRICRGGDDHVQVTCHIRFPVFRIDGIDNFFDLFLGKPFKASLFLDPFKETYDHFPVHKKDRIPFVQDEGVVDRFSKNLMGIDGCRELS